MMELWKGRRALICVVVLGCVLLVKSEALPYVGKEDVPAYAAAVVSEAAETIVQKLGWNKSEALKISSVDMKDAKLGETVMYEFDVEIGGVVLPLILREEITSWRFLEELEDTRKDEDFSNGAINLWKSEFVPATLKPFQLAGPVDLWITEPDKLRLAMPNDVDAGIVKRVLIADGAAVTVEGAREVSLALPLEFPLPLLGDVDDDGLASALLHLASRLRLSSRSEDKKPVLSMKIVGPSALVASSAPESEQSESTQPALKVKRLSPSAVELVSRTEIEPVEAQVENAPDVNKQPPWLWPLASLNGSNPKLLVLEQALLPIFGQESDQMPSSARLVKAKASVTSFVKISFKLERPVMNETEAFPDWPDWAPKPKVERLQFEVLAMVDEGRKLRAININQIESVSYPTMTFSWGLITGNQTMTSFSTFLGTVDPMTLDYNSEDFL